MRVVSACVHYADLLTFVFTGGLAGKRQLRFLTHRQTVHVGTQRDNGAGTPSCEECDDAGPGYTGLRLQAEATKTIGDVLRGLDFAIGELGMFVEVSPPRDHLRFDSGHETVDVRPQRGKSLRFLRGSGFTQKRSADADER